MGRNFYPSPNHLHGEVVSENDLIVSGNLTVVGLISAGGISGSGEANTAANIGGAEGVFANKSGVTLNFRTLTGAGTVSVLSGSNTITISGSPSAPGSGEANVGANTGSGEGVFQQKNGLTLQFRSLLATGSTALVSGSDTITISGSFPPATYYEDGGQQELVVSNLIGELADPQKVSVTLNNGATIGSRHIINFRTGSGISISVAEDIAGDKIDIAITGTATGGEVNTGENIGSGEGVFATKNNLNLQFRSLTASGSVSIISGSNTINISGSGEVNTGANTGSGEGVFLNKTNNTLNFRALTGSGGTTIISGSNGTIIISSSYTGSIGETNLGSNAGAGEGIFQQKNGVTLQFRSIVSSGSITIGSGSNTISISSSFSNTQNVGSGQPVVQNVNVGIISFKTITGSGSVVVTSGSDGRTLNISSSFDQDLNTGPGEGIVQSSNNNISIFRSIQGLGAISVISGSNVIQISASAVASTAVGVSGAVQYISSSNFASSPSVLIGTSGYLTSSVMFIPSSSIENPNSLGITGSLTGGFSFYVGKTFDGVSQPLLQNALAEYRVNLYNPAWQPFFWRPQQTTGTLPLFGGGVGCSFSTIGALSGTYPTTGSFSGTMMSLRISSSVTSGSYATLFSGLGVGGTGFACVGGNPGEGGFYSCQKFSLEIDPTGSSAFFGAGQIFGGGIGTPISRSHHIGLSYEFDQSNTGSWYLTSCGANRTNPVRLALTTSNPGVINNLTRQPRTGSVIMLELFNPPGSASAFYVRVRTQQSATTFTEHYNGVLTGTSIPQPGRPLVLENYCRVGTGGAGALVRMYGINGAIGGGFIM